MKINREYKARDYEAKRTDAIKKGTKSCNGIFKLSVLVNFVLIGLCEIIALKDRSNTRARKREIVLRDLLTKISFVIRRKYNH